MSKRTFEDTVHGAAPNAKRVRTATKDTMPSNFYKECNKIYAQIEVNKYDTKEIIKRLMRKGKIDKELDRLRSQISWGSRKSKSSIVPAAPLATGRQNAPVETDSTQKTASASAGVKPNGNVEMKTIMLVCLSSLVALVDLNKQLLEQHHGASTSQPVAFETQGDMSFLDLNFDDLGF